MLAICSGAFAQQIMTRGALNALLTSSTSDDFEAFQIGVGAATNLDIASLDSNSIALGQGPGLVKPGATYVDPTGVHLQWNGDQYVGLNSKTILANGGGGGTIKINYNVFTQAMGLDAKAFLGFGYTGTMDVYDNAGALVGSANFGLGTGGGETSFIGWQNNAGIGSVVISSPNFSWSPIIDDHTYGVVPEPVSMIALGTGLLALARRRRK